MIEEEKKSPNALPFFNLGTMIYNTAVVGGGLSGMIAAYELAKVGESVILYESQGELGGFAKSATNKNGSFDEHSWRSFGDFYKNLQDVMDSLGIRWPEKSVKLTPFPHVPFRLTTGDIKMFGRLVQGMASSSLQWHRTQSWYEVNKSDVSPWGMVTLGRFNKSGSDYGDIPYSTLVRVVEMILVDGGADFRISPIPIQEYLINPLHQKLVELGVDIRLNTEVSSLSPRDLNADTVIAAIPPVAYAKMETTGLYPFAVKKMNNLALETQHQEISFRVFFNQKLSYPSTLTFDLHQSAWGLLIMPCDVYYDGDERFSGNSVWSGTCTYMKHQDRYGRRPTDCTPAEFKQSVMEQIMECRELGEWFASGGVDLKQALRSIRDFKIWEKWQPGSSGRLMCPEVMAVNSYRETWSRPMAGSKLGPGIFLAGAHAGTGCDMWLMESAAEAGKRAAIRVLDSKNKDTGSVFLDPHDRWPLRYAMMTGIVIIGSLVSLFLLARF